MAKFRVQHRRSGIDYGYQYRSSLKGAIKLAQSLGWYVKGSSLANLEPIEAEICVRHLDEGDRYPCWELIARVDAKGIHPLHWSKRLSVSKDMKQIEELTKRVDEAKDLSTQLQEMALADEADPTMERADGDGQIL